MKRVSRNLLSLALGEVGSRFFGFLATAYLARILQPENFGLINVGAAVLGYLFLATGAGTNLYGARLSAQTEGTEREVVSEILSVRFFLALLCTVSTSVVIFFSPEKIFFFLVVLYALSLTPMALSLEWFFQGKEIMHGVGWSRIATNLTYFLILLFIVHTEADLLQVPIAFLIGNGVGAVILFFIFTKTYGPVTFDWKFSSLFRKEGRWFQILKNSLAIGFGIVLSQISFHFPPILLGVTSTAASVGYYAAAGRIVFFLMVFDRLVTTVLLPAIARYQKVSPHQLQPIFSFVLRMMAIVVFPVCVGGVLLADPLVNVIYGSGFANAVPVLQWLIWYFFFSALGSVYVFGLIGIGQERIYSKMMLYGTVGQIASIVFCTAIWDAAGAAVGYAIGEALIFVLMVSQFRKFFDIAFWQSIAKPLVAAVCMGLILLMIRSYALPVKIAIGAATFFFALVFIGGLTKEDITEVKAKLL